MSSPGLVEILLVVGVILLLFAPDRAAKIAKSFGKCLRAVWEGVRAAPNKVNN